MTANVNIKRGDLHLAVSTAFNRGRYVLMTGGGDGQPIEITIDLRERPDDLFGTEFADVEDDGMVPDRIRTEGGVWVHVQRPADAPPVTDDHGPAIPAQPETFDAGLDRRLRETFPRAEKWPPAAPRVYEFALQDFKTPDVVLAEVEIEDAPDQESVAAADWVHVYDRVTRERRTLKRPEPDAVLTGLRDVAADLRAVGRGDVHRAAVDMARGAPVEPPFGCAARDGVPLSEGDKVLIDGEPVTIGAPVLPLPPVGPLTSTEGLRAGDVLRVVDAGVGTGLTNGQIVTVIEPKKPGPYVFHSANSLGHFQDRFAFVGRPHADGWMAWAGGENPVPGAMIEATYADGEKSRWPCESEKLAEYFIHEGQDDDSEKIIAFRIVDTPPAV